LVLSAERVRACVIEPSPLSTHSQSNVNKLLLSFPWRWFEKHGWVLFDLYSSPKVCVLVSQDSGSYGKGSFKSEEVWKRKTHIQDISRDTENIRGNRQKHFLRANIRL